MYTLVDLCESVCVHVYPYMIMCIFPICMCSFGGFGDFCLNYLFKFEVGHILLTGEHSLAIYSILSTNNKGAMRMCNNGIMMHVAV